MLKWSDRVVRWCNRHNKEPHHYPDAFFSDYNIKLMDLLDFVTHYVAWRGRYD